jgi:uncharacterized protein DUF6471
MPKKYRRGAAILPHIRKALGKFLKDKLEKKMTYREFAKKFASYDKRETEASIRCKLSRGTYSALFLILALDIVKPDKIELWRIMNSAKRATANEKRASMARKRESDNLESENSSRDDWRYSSHMSHPSPGSIGGWNRPKMSG